MDLDFELDASKKKILFRRIRTNAIMDNLGIDTVTHAQAWILKKSQKKKNDSFIGQPSGDHFNQCHQSRSYL